VGSEFWSSFGVPLAGTSGAGRLEPRLSLVTFEAFRERRLFAADLGAGAMVHDGVVAVDVVLADQLGLVRLLEGGFEPLANIGCMLTR
jgi:hypothetical protein